MTDKRHADFSSLTQTLSAGVNAWFPEVRSCLSRHRIADSSSLVPIGGYDDGCRDLCLFCSLVVISYHITIIIRSYVYNKTTISDCVLHDHKSHRTESSRS